MNCVKSSFQMIQLLRSCLYKVLLFFSFLSSRFPSLDRFSSVHSKVLLPRKRANHEKFHLCIQLNIPISFNAPRTMSEVMQTTFSLSYGRLHCCIKSHHGNIQFKLSAWMCQANVRERRRSVQLGYLYTSMSSRDSRTCMYSCGVNNSAFVVSWLSYLF